MRLIGSIEQVIGHHTWGKFTQFSGCDQLCLHANTLQHGYIRAQLLSIVGSNGTNKAGFDKATVSADNIRPMTEISVTTEGEASFNLIGVVHTHKAT